MPPIETGVDDGMQNFNQALYNLVKERKITEKEAMPRRPIRRRSR
jgi:Tfp pilus assembly ATPase PilU